MGGFRLVEAKYPALLFKQQLDAFVQKIFPMMRDNVKKNITPLLVTFHDLDLCSVLVASLTTRWPVVDKWPDTCFQGVVCVQRCLSCGGAGRDRLVHAVLYHRVSAFTPRVAHTAGARQEPCRGGPAQLLVTQQPSQPAHRTRPGVTSWWCLMTCSPSSRVSHCKLLGCML